MNEKEYCASVYLGDVFIHKQSGKTYVCETISRHSRGGSPEFSIVLRPYNVAEEIVADSVRECKERSESLRQAMYRAIDAALPETIKP